MQRYVRQHVDGVRLLLQAPPGTLSFYSLRQGSPSPAAGHITHPLRRRRGGGIPYPSPTQGMAMAYPSLTIG
jgi:hypothetical protein